MSLALGERARLKGRVLRTRRSLGRALRLNDYKVRGLVLSHRTVLYTQ